MFNVADSLPSCQQEISSAGMKMNEGEDLLPKLPPTKK